MAEKAVARSTNFARNSGARDHGILTHISEVIDRLLSSEAAPERILAEFGAETEL